MSNVNIKRAVENIKSGTTAYTPIIEVIVNSIQAIEAKAESSGKIKIVVERSDQGELDGSLPAIENFEISDNGIGFTPENRESFDTLYSDHKMLDGGKGFGRFICLKYFENMHVDSIYQEGSSFKKRSFSMGKSNDIIVNEKVAASAIEKTGARIRLASVKDGRFTDKKITTIARNLVEKLLPYFITDGYFCPEITIEEADGSGSIVLNEFISNELSGVIKEVLVPNSKLTLKGIIKDQEFSVRVFKLYSPKSQRSKISLVAHKREVTEAPIHSYIPEFIEEFYDKDSTGQSNRERNFIIKAYVFGEYLDGNVTLERGGFNFQKDNDVLLGISQSEIEKAAAEVAIQAVGEDIHARQDRKSERVKTYVEEEAPWHRNILKDIDLSAMPYNAPPAEIESLLQKEKYEREVTIRREVVQLLEEGSIEELKENVTRIVSKISESSKNDLIHYIALRRNVLDVFRKSLEIDPDGKYSSEGAVHDIIFPRKSDSEKASFEEHNLWIIDERLNFTNYVSSDLPLGGGNIDRPDLIVYDRRVLFRGDNEVGNPVTIFEFKKPQRDDFVNPSSSEDPVQQIVRYVNRIRDGEYKTPQGRKILVAENTPFYGYVVCDITPKVEKWLEREKDFKPMPDRLGWFQWQGNINLYIEVLSWDKVLKDADIRNKVFFHKLGI